MLIFVYKTITTFISPPSILYGKPTILTSHFITKCFLPVSYFEQINLDHNFFVEHSETSDNRPYTTSNVLPEPTLEEHNLNTIPHYTQQNTVQLNQDDFMDHLQTQQSQQLNPILAQQQQDPATLQLNPSETGKIQNASEKTVHNTQSFTLISDSNLIQVPIHDTTQNTTDNQTQNDITQSTNQDNTSTLSKSYTNITQPFQTQQTSPQNYDPPSLPLQYSTQISPHNSPQQGSSNTQTTNTVHFQTTTPTTQPIVQTLTYAPAPSNQTQSAQTGLNIKTLHSNPMPNYTTSRSLSRPPLQSIPTNPLSYNLASTNPGNTQHSTTNNNELNPLNTFPPSLIKQREIHYKTLDSK